MVNPSFEEMGQNYKLKGIVPQYSCRGSLTQKVIRDSVKTALLAERPETIIPPEFCKNTRCPIYITPIAPFTSRIASSRKIWRPSALR